MCGLVGLFNYGNPSRTPEETLLRRMADRLRHRGPDDEGYFREGPIGLGFRRLSIIDLSGGRQPMGLAPCREGDGKAKSLWIVFNGEVYNFRQLRADLEKAGHRFSSHSDTETILHGYEEWGENVLLKLRGMFAFALWDSRARRLFLARDRLGKKPLYWAVRDGALLFASEIKALLEALSPAPAVDPLAIHDYLTYQYVPSPRTVFQGVERLLPAHALVCDAQGNVRQRRYWHPETRPKTSLSFPEAKERLLHLLREATRLRLEADVPLGAFLSGGVDSSAVVGLMAQAGPGKVKTFSVGFAEEAFNELPYARRVAQHFSTDHIEILVKADMMSVLPRIAWQHDQPYADSSALPSFFVARETRKHVTVALNGDGGDESFGGYHRYLFDAWMVRWAGRLPRPARRALAGLSRLFPEKWMALRLGRRLLQGLRCLPEDPLRVNISLARYFGPEDKRALYTDHFHEQTAARDSEDYLMGLYAEGGADDPLDQILHADLHSYLPEDLLVKMDVATMTHSLEGRSPLLDHEVVEFAASLPSHWKIKGSRTKHILKEALRGLLPDEILDRRKMGFGIPLKKWLQTDHHEKVRSLLLSKESLQRGYFRKDGLERLLEEHRRGLRDHGFRLWALLMLELWHKVFVDKTLGPEDPL